MNQEQPSAAVDAPPPRLVSCYFGAPGDAWHRMAEVLRFSAGMRLPGWQHTIEAIGPSTYVSAIGVYQHAANAHKQAYWADAVDAAPDGMRMLLIDADTMILRPLDDVWRLDFDFAYTVRRRSRFPLNGGVVFLRVSDQTRRFMRRWCEQTATMLADPTARTTWRKDYGGVAQAALVTLLEKNDHGLATAQLQCAEWNCEDSAWAYFTPNVTRILHIKGLLRHCVFDTKKTYNPVIKRLAHRWRAIEEGCRRLQQQSA